MKNKLKHLAKFCCKPANELEFEAVKMAAEIGGVEFDDLKLEIDEQYVIVSQPSFGSIHTTTKSVSKMYSETEISVIDFCNKLRMTEEEAEKLEDDRVDITFFNNEVAWKWNEDKSLIALNGHYFKTNDDGTEVTLHKRKSC